MRAREQADRVGLATALGRITDAVSRLMSEHLALARVELREDARILLRGAERIALFAPLIVVGYAFVCAALALALASLIGLGWSLLVLGVLNIVVGVLGAYVTWRRVEAQEMLNATRMEVSRSAEVLGASPTDGPERRLEA